MDDGWQPVREWHRVVNDRDVAAADKVVTADVRLGGPQGAAAGAEVFLDWIERSGMRLDPVAWHPVAEGAVVVEQDATWPGRPDAEGQPPQRVATLFRLCDGRVASALRYDSLGDALAAARG